MSTAHVVARGGYQPARWQAIRDCPECALPARFTEDDVRSNSPGFFSLLLGLRREIHYACTCRNCFAPVHFTSDELPLWVRKHAEAWE